MWYTLSGQFSNNVAVFQLYGIHLHLRVEANVSLMQLSYFTGEALRDIYLWSAVLLSNSTPSIQILLSLQHLLTFRGRRENIAGALLFNFAIRQAYCIYLLYANHFVIVYVLICLEKNN